MLWSCGLHLLALLFDLLAARRHDDRAKDLEIALLRQQVRLLQREHRQPPHLSRWDRLVLALLAYKLRVAARRARRSWHHSLLLFSPATLLRWHRELVQRTWTCRRHQRGGRPPLDPELKALILHLARENPRWGYGRIQGELTTLGHRVGRSTVRDLLKRQHVPPAPERARRGPTWRAFLRHYQQQVLAADFFTVKSVLCQTIYALFFIEVRTRRVYLAGCTRHPTTAWVTQQARNLAWLLQEGTLPVTILLHDRDAKFPPACDAVFRSEGLQVVQTPARCPQANGYAERWVGSARRECLDHLLILHERHLLRVLTAYTDIYNQRRPHQGMSQRCPIPLAHGPGQGPIARHDVLGGIIHDYERREIA
jgi:hypothetical protein